MAGAIYGHSPTGRPQVEVVPTSIAPASNRLRADWCPPTGAAPVDIAPVGAAARGLWWSVATTQHCHLSRGSDSAAPSPEQGRRRPP
ncbi:hypothetical protein BHE74_00014838 [Ensete ventricosum]|nr:hypothetical protein BHE74_00014838 [Ensete ventricosum]